MPDDDVPRVDELFSRAVVAQLAEQRAQRETFAELERKLEAVEQLVAERLSELSKLLRGGEVQTRMDLLEEGLSERIRGLEKVVQASAESRLAALETTVKRRLGQLEEAMRVDDTGRRLAALEQAMTERFAELEGAVRADQVGDRLGGLEQSMDERLSQVEEAVRDQELARRLDALEQAMDERLGHLEESVRSEEIGDRLKAIELAVDDWSHRSDDQSVSYRLTRLEGSLRRLEEHTMSGLEELKEAGQAAEAGILERIIVESQVVGAQFQAVRPAVEAAAEARPELQEALAEVRELVEAARSGLDASNGDSDTGPFPADALRPPPEGDGADTVFQAPEETPIPERRFGGLRQRREKSPPGV